MSEHTNDHPDDDIGALSGAGRRRRPILTHPLVVVVLAVAAAVALFAMGRATGSAIYRAFDGDGAAAATYGGLMVSVLVLTITIGVLLDRQRRGRQRRDG